MLPPREVYQQVRQLEIRSRRLVTDALTGAYHSIFKGQGMDFEQVREYQPGDDVRGIDWNVSARMNRPFIKQFREERELTVFLLLDLSASGDYGSTTQTKRERAAELACVLSLAAARNHDKVGLLLFTDRVEHLLLPKKGRRHLLRLLRDCLHFAPQGQGTDIPNALDTLNRVQKRRCITFLLSDFHDPTLRSTLLPKLDFTHRRHDLTAFILSDPTEHAIPQVGTITLEDAETGTWQEVNTRDPAVRDAYVQQARQHYLDLTRRLSRIGIPHLPISTDGPYIQALRQHFQARQHRATPHH